MIGTTVSQYKITEKLGEGGMGVVYKAEDTSLGRTVTLKFLAAHLLQDEEAKKRFRREAKAAAALHHPNVCPVYEIGEAEGRTFLAMAFIEGEALDNSIERGPLKIADALDIAQQIAKGLEAAHEKGIVHRDIKPGNVIVDDKGHVTVMDFGLALLTEGSKLTQLDTTVGTVAYMSPEQAEGAEVDRRTDIWALGCVLYEMVCGQRPFKGQYDQALLYEIVNQEPEPLTGLRAGVPMELEWIVGKCLAKQAAQRFQQVGELVVDLDNLREKVKSGRSTVIRTSQADHVEVRHDAAVDPQTMATQTQRTAGGHTGAKLPWGVAVLLAVCCGLLAYLHWADSSHSPPRVARRLVLIPESIDAPPFGGVPSISPDGRMFVYRADETDGRLWLWSLTDGTARSLAGTENASPRRPFWSPDSRAIGFISQDRQSLMRVDLDSGSTTRLFVANDFRVSSASWSPDGNQVVFSAGARTRTLYSTPALGGEPEPITVLIADTPDWDVQDPHFLPTPAAPNQVLISAGTLAEALSVYLLDLETGVAERLTDGFSPVYAPSGHILALREDSSVWALPYSADDRRVNGDAFPIADGYNAISASAEGSLLLGRSQGARRSEIRHQLVLHDGSGNRIANIGPPLYRMVTPAVSPDGRRVIVSGAKRRGSDPDLWLFDFDRSAERRLTSEPGIDDLAHWHPNGVEVVYRNWGEGAGDLFVIPIEGLAERRPLVQGPVRETTPHWSHTGDVLVYGRLQSDGRGFDIHYLRDVASGNQPESIPFLTSDFNEVQPQLSPNGRYIAYVENSSGASQIYVRPFPKGSPVWQISESGGTLPRWSRDGAKLFWNDDDVMMRATLKFDQESLVGEVQPLFEAAGLDFANFTYDVTPDDGFVITIPVDPDTSAGTVQLFENWYEEFRDREQD